MPVADDSPFGKLQQTTSWYGPDIVCYCEGWRSGRPVHHQDGPKGHRVICTNCEIETPLFETAEEAKAEWPKLLAAKRS